ncbi:hypothetical protein AURANDRAFT_63917 [Aureococcus anophagefferens]|uniref:Band 7 domain-containing protein n=1 Tax=Aureococcus anophagefferens TaxID=44056 RepID=F0Y890_AURAN|nr:hypothetical protein AURANDRAFT_63917 [Aureococcus anophagefferens]EGB08754.1 hypothetical protein AURANDRAFT_63917 [Aureococcus anophagefferens]|eukprot:XP_009036739.1 hypothetical protein AURANDRAFT_63917 [Aureococcus anophagefferens]
MDGRYHCPVKDAQRLGLDDPRAKKAHPDAGGSAASFRGVADAHERLLAFRSERAAGALRERRFQSKYHAKSDFADRITHVLSRPLGNLVSTQTKLRFRLGAFAVLMAYVSFKMRLIPKPTDGAAMEKQIDEIANPLLQSPLQQAVDRGAAPNVVAERYDASLIPQGQPLLSKALGCLCLPCTCLGSWVLVNPKEELVSIHFGEFSGVVNEPGLHYVNMWGRELRKISTAQQNLEVPGEKVLDAMGCPLVASAVVTFRFSAPANTLLNTANPYGYVATQAKATLKQVCARYPYDSHTLDGSSSGPSLRGECAAVEAEMVAALQDRVRCAGATVLTMTLSELNYAPEIAGAMLKRQEAIAMLGARQTVVDGAYKIAQKTIARAEADGVAFMEGQKASLVSNLVITAASEVRVQPTLPLA